MYLTLFQIAGFAAPAWLLLIFLPTWRVTRWLAKTAVVPALLCAIYVVGIIALINASGFGFMRDFGNAAGVTRLLARQEVAIVAWIHILAFDQLVGLFIYRDNMEHRFVPIPVQSVLLFLTFMLGPVGFLSYYLLRRVRGGRGIFAISPTGGDTTGDATRDSAPGQRAEVMPIEPFGTPPNLRSLIAMGWDRLMMNPAVTWMAIIGLLVGGFCLVVLLLRGGVPIPPEGDLMKPASFDIAVGLYLLTLALLLPGAQLSKTGRRWWIGTTGVFTIYGFSIETIQAFRGLDPRFSRVGGPTDQILGGVFFLVAVGLIVLFLVLAARYLRPGRPDAGSPVLLAIRYGCVAVFAAFAAGLWMSFNSGRVVGASGSILPLHAIGFHGLQAVPAIALLLVWAGFPPENTRRWVHIAGITWLGAIAAIAYQTAAGRSVAEVSAATLAAAFVLLVWSAVALFALWTWARSTPTTHTPHTPLSQGLGAP